MDAYHKVLAKLYEATNGKETETVDFKELVKSIGFLPSYSDIFQQMSRQGWIAETPRPDVVKITHWGVKEARKFAQSDGAVDQSSKKEANRVLAEARELVVFVEEMVQSPSSDSVSKAEGRAQAIIESLRRLKSSL